MIGRLLARIRSLWLGIVQRSRIEAEMAEEFRHHIEMRTADLVRSGLTPTEARRRAHLEFGHQESHKEAARASRGLRRFDGLRVSWIDVKLGARMLVKHPALTVVAVCALAVGIPVGMAPMHVSHALEAPLPEDADDRVSAIRLWDPARMSVALPTYHELRSLRDQLTTFDLVGAFRRASYNLEAAGTAEPVAGAEVTSSTFDLLGTPPLLGRTLNASDEVPGAPHVVVVGYDVWQARFGGDADIVGRTVHVAGVPHTAVGVMPRGFLFPMNEQVWLPLRDEPSAQPGQGRELFLVGRLAEGVSREQAQAEVTGVGQRLGPERSLPGTRLQFQVVPFAFSFAGIPRGGLAEMPEFYVFQALALVLLLVACGNVAMLIFARTVTRSGELAVRTALGASRGRIVSQIFIEALVLAVVSAGIGLASVHWLLGRVPLAALAGETALPYWFSLGVTPRAVLWALFLAVLSATVAGVIPAVRLSGKKVQQNMQRARSNRSGVRSGGVTSAIIVVDVAVAVAVVGLALGLSEQLTNRERAQALTGIAADRFLAVDVRLPVSELQGAGGVDLERFTARLGETQRAITARLRAEPGVRGVAVADALPRMDHRSRLIEVEGIALDGGEKGRYVRTARVDVTFFDALRQPVLAGRGFDGADLESDPRPVIVNSAFVEDLLQGRNPIGHRVRPISSGDAPAPPWQEIVGVVGHLGMNIVNPKGEPGLYLPAAAGDIYPLRLGIEVGEDPGSFAPRVRELLAEAEPTAFVRNAVVLSRVHQGDWYLTLAVAGGFTLLAGILIALATSGIYAIMSFSISERTREIGVRTALGAGRPSLALTILGRSLSQIGLGALIGTSLAAWILLQFREVTESAGSTGRTIGVAVGLGLAIVVVVALLSCAAPTRRALGIEPCRALRAES